MFAPWFIVITDLGFWREPLALHAKISSDVSVEKKIL